MTFPNRILLMDQPPMAIGIDPKVAFAFKKLLGSRDHPEITIHFLNSVLGGDPLIKSVEILNPFNEKDFEDDKLSILDVKATDDQGRLLDIEMQTSLPGELANRLIFYAASQYVTQLREGARYANLMPSIGISVLDGILFQEVPDLHLDFRLRSQSPALTLSDALQVHLLELPKYTPPGDNIVVQDPLEQWVYFFRRAAYLTGDELTSRLVDPVFTEAARVLEMISRSPDDRALYEARLKLQRDEQSRLEAAEARGKEIGTEIGKEIGEARGRIQGKIQLLQGLLNEPESPADLLSTMSDEALTQLQASLQERLRSRG
ncbi:Rpn family recombination-promoting nuclease/putative transposase [Stieleria varia]|uniref:PD-(D/E)XK nuclease family transposase n=1 Tax=Stieleria varia TaxID=2528005 RepID=A0A5C6APA6_9BACT|nr:Rpn family recombination-promoting nuclease/putative transposase [Stieleria varia]TWU00946.1 PD-(D/E)XK nuclease family transposase [Stieleria varia]